MRCARCHRDTASVEERESPYYLILCDICYEYEKTWYAFKGESMSKDHTEFHRLYNRLSELTEQIESFKAAELQKGRDGQRRVDSGGGGRQNTKVDLSHEAAS